MNSQNPIPATLRAYLERHDVELIPCSSHEPGDPFITIPIPDGWVTVPDEMFPHAYSVLIAPAYAEHEWTPNAVLLHGRLSRWRPTDELIETATSEAQTLPEWVELRSSHNDFAGHRSVFIHGGYCVDGMGYEAATRYLVVDHEYDRYLTQLTVTTPRHPHSALAADAATIHSGLAVESATRDSEPR
ncbi:LpqN/LpqT family lipoprotein [Rhodococcus sp. SJ-2]